MTNKKILLLMVLLLVLVGSITVSAMDVSVVTGTKVGLDVKHDFEHATIKVSPETSKGYNNYHVQDVIVTNPKKDKGIYIYIDPYFDNKDLKNIKLTQLTRKLEQVPKIINDCEKTDEICPTKINGTTEKLITSETPITLVEKKDWGTAKHTFNNKGYYLPANANVTFRIRYETLTSSGKWNMRVWGNEFVDDWRTILDVNQNALFDYTIDPWYDNVTLNLTSYWKFDEGTGTSVSDYFNNNTLRLNNTWDIGWDLSGILSNALKNNYTTGTGVAVNYSCTNCPANKGTFSFWLKAQATSKDHIVVDILGSSVLQRNLIDLEFPTTYTAYLKIQVRNGGSYSTPYNCPLNAGAFAWKNNTWTFFVVEWDHDAPNYHMYMNGAELTGCSGGISVSVANTHLYVANSYAPASNTVFNGSIDEMGMWNNQWISDYGLGTIEGLYNSGIGCSAPFSSCGSGSNDSNFTINTAISYTSSPQYETNGTYVYINYSYGQNVSNISSVDLNIYEQNVTPTQLSNGSCGTNCSYQYFGAFVRNPLVLTNGTVKQFNFTYVSNYNNATSYSNSTNNQSMTIYWAYYPVNIFVEAQAIETRNTTWNNSYATIGNTSEVSFLYSTNYTEYSTITVNSTSLYENSSDNQNVTFYYQIPMLNSTDIALSNLMIPMFNVTFNGTTMTRNTSVSANQGVYKILLTNCSDYSITGDTTNQIYIRDIVTNSLLSGNSDFNFTVWLQENYGIVGLERNYSFSFTTNSSPKICIYPRTNLSTQLNYVYKSDKNYSASMLGYLSSSGSDIILLTNSSQTSTIFLTNASAVQDVIITITDQNDNELTNYSVAAYLYQNGSYSLVDTEVSNLQGQVKFNLYILGTLYQFRVSYPNGTVAKVTPLTGGTTIISTSFTIKVYLSPIASLVTSIGMQNINHTLTYSNVSGLVNLTFDDTSTNYTSYNCLQILNVSSGLLILNNCTTNQTGTFTYTLTGNGSFVASYTAINAEDGGLYLVDNLFITRGGFQNLEQEGVFWAFLFIGTITMIGLMINPILGVIFLEFGVIASYLIGFMPLTYGALLSILATGLLVAFIMGRE